MSRNLSNASIVYANGIITTKLYGIFNESSAESYREDLFKLVMGLKGKPFALLADISLVEGATPEAFDIVKHIIKRLPEMGLIAKAYVYKGPVIRGIMYQRIPELASMDYLFFTDDQEAYQWLSKEYLQKLSSHS
ncbi:hypothetical protein D1814_03575 [Alteromonas sp. BL110]|uniref:hypothetical protein n=1 Tax=Alteromonas sp. BL110 TaxID=1714845 RepID=UPI000E513C3C|nr:hypothetical protein [Alteromonas sp. BL110]AXT37819.1 hypothetical protein D1814_03575 [Alteromonas sp. BL110]RKM80559.1 hypothetical protein D7031_16920 [Alteromonas sp. BL110]